EFFEQARKEAEATSPAPRATPSPRAVAAATPPAAPPKKGGSKTVPILIGAAVLGGAGVAVAAGGGGDDGGGGNNNTQTGPLSFRLTWSSNDDLDLYVVEPSGFVLSWQAAQSPTGGRFVEDVGCTGGQATEVTEWSGNAPRGTYTFWATYPGGSCSTGRPASFTLTVSRGNSVLATQSGTVNLSGESAHFVYVN
ncbi:MAG TPA: hypothetical protein VFO85_15295, partial [Vicinamibacteria bacterium]|nr:hypothetical protein [Vicinamibacteria bacterium]